MGRAKRPVSSFRLSQGLREAERQRHHVYPNEYLDLEGPYGSALKALIPYIKRNWPEHCESPRLHYELHLQLIHECEQAKGWLERSRAGEEDFETAQISHREEARTQCARAIEALDALVSCDEMAPYYIRSAFARGICAAVGPPEDFDHVFSDQNRDDGGLHVKLDGERRQKIEYQFAMRGPMANLREILFETRTYLNLWSEPTSAPWHQVGNLRFMPPLSRKSRAGLVKGRDSLLGAAILGLSVSLSEWFRDWSLAQGKRQRWVGEKVKAEGRPNWGVVAEFVNVTFDLEEVETAESIRQRVTTVCRGREVRVMNWPMPAIREPQLQKK
jgi:hypothetical protein